MEVRLTDGDSHMGAHVVDVGEGDGTHSDLVVGPGEKGCKGAAEGDASVAGGHTDGHTNHVLLGDIALDELVRELVLQGTNVRECLRRW